MVGAINFINLSENPSVPTEVLFFKVLIMYRISCLLTGAKNTKRVPRNSLSFSVREIYLVRKSLIKHKFHIFVHKVYITNIGCIIKYKITYKLNYLSISTVRQYYHHIYKAASYYTHIQSVIFSKYSLPLYPSNCN